VLLDAFTLCDFAGVFSLFRVIRNQPAHDFERIAGIFLLDSRDRLA